MDFVGLCFPMLQKICKGKVNATSHIAPNANLPMIRPMLFPHLKSDRNDFFLDPGTWANHILPPRLLKIFFILRPTVHADLGVNDLLAALGLHAIEACFIE